MGVEMLQGVGFTNYTTVKDDIWFCDAYHSNLLKMQLHTGEISLEAALLTENINGKMQYGPTVCVRDNIILAPRNAGDILIYHRCTGEMVRLPLKKGNVKQRKPLFLSGFVYDDYAFFIPGNYPAMIKVNAENMSVEYFENFYYALPAEIRKRNSILCNSNALVIDNYCVFPVFDSNFFIKVCLDFSGYEMEQIGEAKYRILSMAYIDETIWFAGLEGIFEYSVKERSVVCHNKAFTQNQLLNGIGQIVNWQENLVVIPINGEKLILFHSQKHDCVEFQDYVMPLSPGNNDKWVLTGANIICCGKLNDDVLCMFSTFEKEICLIDLKNHFVRRYEGKLEKQSADQIIELYIIHNIHNQIINENDVCLDDYIRYISKSEW